MNTTIPDSMLQDVLDNLLEGCQILGFDWTYKLVWRCESGHLIYGV
ncbi:hypothetical protein KKC22_00060 [Myxococcota bacterium]|nr:hypothetical protein [Myxococcota bacterium]